MLFGLGSSAEGSVRPLDVAGEACSAVGHIGGRYDGHRWPDFSGTVRQSASRTVFVRSSHERGSSRSLRVPPKPGESSPSTCPKFPSPTQNCRILFGKYARYSEVIRIPCYNFVTSPLIRTIE